MGKHTHKLFLMQLIPKCMRATKKRQKNMVNPSIYKDHISYYPSFFTLLFEYGTCLRQTHTEIVVKDKKLIEREKMEKNGYLSNTKRWFYAEKKPWGRLSSSSK